MKCKEVFILLWEYYENTLDLQKREMVKQHLAGCESCKAKLSEIEHAYQLLAKEELPQPEESFWTDFLPQVRARIERKEGRKLTFVPKPRLAFGLMSVVVVVALSFFLFNVDKKNMVKLRTDPMVETILPESDLSSYMTQLAEILSSQEDQSLPLETFLSSGGRGDLELTEKILDEDYLRQRNLNSVLNELSLEELKQLEESIKTLQIGDIL